MVLVTSISIATNLADLPAIGGALDGATLKVGYSEQDVSRVAETDDLYEGTVALNYAAGPFSLGIQKNGA